MIVLGVDPGTATTGWGIICEKDVSQYRIIDSGAIQTKPQTNFPERLKIIHHQLKQIITRHHPDSLAIEELFFAKNVKTAVSVSHARGVVLFTAAESGLPVYEYTPLQTKQSLTGYGKADKVQVQKMVKAILNLPEIPKPDDVADALAVALCHLQSIRFYTQVEQAK